MNEISVSKKEPRGAEALERDAMEIVYVLQANINGEKYCVTDLRGSLSRNIMDSMLFWDEVSAASYAGPVESLIEERANRIATIKALRVPRSGVIPKTPFECIPSP